MQEYILLKIHITHSMQITYIRNFIFYKHKKHPDFLKIFLSAFKKLSDLGRSLWMLVAKMNSSWFHKTLMNH